MSVINSLKKLAREYGLTKLSKESGVSRPHIHRIFSGKSSPSLETLESLAGVLNLSIELKIAEKNSLHLEKLEELQFAMAKWGAPLVIADSLKKKLKNFTTPSFETTFLAALQMGRKAAMVNSVLPMFIHKNRGKINFEKIIETFDDKRYLGYLLDLLYRITSERCYLLAMSKLEPEKIKFLPLPLIKNSQENDFQKNLFKKTINPGAKTWGFLTADAFDDIERRFKKWNSENVH